MRAYTSGLLNGHMVVTALLVELQTNYNVIRFNTSDWQLNWNGEIWEPGNGIISIKQADEDMSGQLHGAIVSIASLSPATTSLALSETLEGRRCVIYRALFSPESMAIIEVRGEFSGRISNLIITKQGVQQ